MSPDRGFPFVSGHEPEFLILGSFPGERSLEERQYYAHPRNTFWKIMETLFDPASDGSYERRLEMIRLNRLALWDVLLSCERPGSMDGSIIEKGAVPNDLDSFFRDHPTVRIICFNGQKAEKLFRRLVLPGLSWLPQSITQKTLPSTSPAYASLNLPEKAAKWALALGVADPSGHLE